MTSYLKPFHWTNPIIYCLPGDKEMLLTSPVPIIAGVLKSKAAFEWDLWPHIKEQENQVIVYLDDCVSDDDETGKGKKKRKNSQEERNSKIVCSPRIHTEFMLPVFDEKLADLKDVYLDYHVMAKVYKSKVDMAFDKHLAIGMNIAVIIRKILEDRIVDMLPEWPNKKMGEAPIGLSHSPPQVDIDYIQKVLIEKNFLDDLFFYNLTQTQSFTHYVHKLYSNKTY